jgi:hypothetical protein
MKYSIFTTANKSYYPFLDIFTNSSLKNCQNLDRIYIADSGLNEYRNPIARKDKVSIIDTNCSDEYSGVHSEGWVKATQMKTETLNKLFHIIDFDHPIVMIDSDVCILKDIESVIDTQYDIQVTTMKTGGHTRSDGIFISEIASFVVFNNPQKCKIFVQEWINKMKEFGRNGTPFPHETPAMNITLRESSNLNIGYLKELQVCADSELTDETYTVHFKSNGSTKDDPITNFERRIMSVQNQSTMDLEIDKYLNEELYDQWKAEYETE